MTRLAAALVATVVAALDCSSAHGQAYPYRPVRIISTDVGGALDTTSRIMATELASVLGQPVIVENHPSAVTPELLARATSDGYTVSLGAGTIWLTPLIQKTPYDPLKDMAPITTVITYPSVLIVLSGLEVKSVKELIALAKAKPGLLNMAATASPGGLTFLATELFKTMAGVDIVRVPYKSNAAGLTGMLVGESQLMFNDLESVSPHVKSGRVRAIAMASLQPFPPAPTIPTLSASGLAGFEAITIAGLLAPGATPPEIIRRLNQEMVRILGRPEIKEKFPNAEVVSSTPEQFAAKIKSEMSKWGKVIKDSGVKTDL